MAKKKNREIGAAARADASAADVMDREPDTNPIHEQIATLAYSLWEARGAQEGSPEDDWFRAERQLNGRLRQQA